MADDMITLLRRVAVPVARVRFLGFLALVGLALLALSHSGEAPIRAEQTVPATGGRPPLPAGVTAPTTNVVRQGFPAAKADANDLTKSETAWEVEWELTHPTNKPIYPPGSVLRIKSAKFMWKDRYGKPRWVTVARMLELAEIYVPYDNGWTAFLDVHDMSFHVTPARKEFPLPELRPAGRTAEVVQSVLERNRTQGSPRRRYPLDERRNELAKSNRRPGAAR
jgi:hypothetical protein